MKLTERNKNGNFGFLTVTGEEMSNQNAIVRMRFRASKLDKKDRFGLSDPFLKFYRIKEDEFGIQKMPCFKTEVRKQNLNPTWSPIEVGIQQLCNADVERRIGIDCYDWDYDGSHDLIGSCVTSVSHLLSLVSSSDPTLELINKDLERTSKMTSQNSSI